MKLLPLCMIVVALLCSACEPARTPAPPQPEISAVSASEEFQRTMKKVTPLILSRHYLQAEFLLLASQGFLRGTEFFYHTQYWLGECALAVGNYRKAQTYLYSAQTGVHNVQIRAAALEGLARAHYFNQEYDQAESYLQILHRRYPSQSNAERILYLLSLVAEKTGDVQKQQGYRRQLQSLYPHSIFLVDRPVRLQGDDASVLAPPSRGAFYLQCGIFRHKKNASLLVNRLKWNGFSPFFIEKKDGTLYVMLGYYQTRERAEAKRKQLKALGFTSIVKQ